VGHNGQQTLNLLAVSVNKAMKHKVGQQKLDLNGDGMANVKLWQIVFLLQFPVPQLAMLLEIPITRIVGLRVTFYVHQHVKRLPVPWVRLGLLFIRNNVACALLMTHVNVVQLMLDNVALAQRPVLPQDNGGHVLALLGL